MTKLTSSETPQIIKVTQKFNLAIGVLMVGGALIIGSIIFLTGNQAKHYVTQIQDYQNLVQSRIATNHIQSLVGSKIDELTTVEDAFPNDSSIIEVMQKLETLVRNVDPQGTVHFAPQGQTKVNNQLGVALNFRFMATPSDTINFLRHLERLPHIIEVNRIEIKTPNGVSNIGETTMGVTLYVQDPFTQPN
jgi:hypothetical protein